MIKIKELSNTISISGYEKTINDIINNELRGHHIAVTNDNIGNLIGFIKGKGKNKKKILVLAHMDEVGIQITNIKEDGKIKFKSVGSVKKNRLLFQRIIFRNGLIGIVAPENANINADQRDLEELCIDCGFSSKKEANNLINIGEVGTFYNNYIENGNIIMSKSLDNRLGCFVLLDAIDNLKDLDNDVYFVFTTQEEVGLKGAKVISNALKPDIAISVDTISVEGIEQLEIGKGVTIKISDSLTICNEELVEILKNIAVKDNILVQLEVTDNGGTELGVIDESNNGVKVAGLSIPIRYAHTANSIANKNDVLECSKLLRRFIEEI